MISFRFYVVTLIAVFLAIALGVVIGSTFLEPTLVENLRNQLDTVQRNLDERLETVDRLNAEIDDLQRYVDQSAPHAASDTLDGVRVVVAAEKGVDDGTVERLVGRIRQAGGDSEGIVWLDPSWRLEDPELQEQLRVALEMDQDTGSLLLDVWTELLKDLTLTAGVEIPGIGAGSDGQSASAPGSGTEPETTSTTGATTTTVPPTAPETIEEGPFFTAPVLQALEDLGLVDLERIDDGEALNSTTPGGPQRLAMVFVTGHGSEFDDGGSFTTGLAREQSAMELPTLVAEIHRETEGGRGRGAFVREIRHDPELSTVVSTVDHLDLLQGQVAVVLAVADLGRGVVGHYGYGDDADRVLPRWPGP